MTAGASESARDAPIAQGAEVAQGAQLPQVPQAPRRATDADAVVSPVWDIALRKALADAGSRFTLDVAFRSDARRLVLHGPSGAGKSMTLRIIAGIARADAGHVRIAGRALWDPGRGCDLPPPQRRVALVFQDYALFPHLTVRQNIAFGLRAGLRNPHASIRDARVERWLARLDLLPVADHQPHQLSGGQRQRTALARAVVIEPAALLLDEPFPALDPRLRQRLRLELLELQQALALPMLLVTHDEADRRVLAEEVVELDAGRIGPAAAGDDLSSGHRALAASPAANPCPLP